MTPTRRGPWPAWAWLRRRSPLPWRRLAPTLLAGTLAVIYVIVSPPSFDLAAHLLRAKLFSAEGFGLWDNWWYGGHHDVLYSVVFPAAAAAVTPQLAAALATVATALIFELIAYRRWGHRAWVGSLWFALGAGTDLYTGRLTFAFGLAPALGVVLALQHRRLRTAAALAFLTALCSPVAALFAAVAAAAQALADTSRRPEGVPAVGLIRRAGPAAGVAVAALLPLALLAVAFPEGGYEPFAFSTLWPLPLIGAGMLILLGRRERVLSAGIVIYTAGVITAWAIPTAVGSNAARLGELVAGPLAALLLWPRRRWLLLALAPALLYIQCQAAVRDVRDASGETSSSSAYYQPLLSFLAKQPGPFRVEVPFTYFHWETYFVAPRFPLARGWERQLDIDENSLFYTGRLTAANYRAWLDRLAVRYVAVADARLDYSAVREVALIDRGLPYLRLLDRVGHWRIYEVLGAIPIAQGAAVATAVGPNSISLYANTTGRALIRVRFTPYWAILKGSGCVSPAGQFTQLELRRPGPVELGIRFSLSRIGARSARCN